VLARFLVSLTLNEYVRKARLEVSFFVKNYWNFINNCTQPSWYNRQQKGRYYTLNSYKNELYAIDSFAGKIFKEGVI